MAQTSGQELLDFLEQFNKKYEEEHRKASEDPSAVPQDIRPAKAPEVAPCQWGFPCNNCGQC